MAEQVTGQTKRARDVDHGRTHAGAAGNREGTSGPAGADFERRRQQRIIATGDAAAITLAFALVTSVTVAFGPLHGSEIVYTVAASRHRSVQPPRPGSVAEPQARRPLGRAGRDRQGRRLHPRRRARRRPRARPGAAPALDHRSRRPGLRAPGRLALAGPLVADDQPPPGPLRVLDDPDRYRRAGDGDRPHRRDPPRGRHPDRRDHRFARRGRGRRSRRPVARRARRRRDHHRRRGAGQDHRQHGRHRPGAARLADPCRARRRGRGRGPRRPARHRRHPPERVGDRQRSRPARRRQPADAARPGLQALVRHRRRRCHAGRHRSGDGDRGPPRQAGGRWARLLPPAAGRQGRRRVRDATSSARCVSTPRPSWPRCRPQRAQRPAVQDGRRSPDHQGRAILRRTSLDELPQLLNVSRATSAWSGPARRCRHEVAEFDDGAARPPRASARASPGCGRSRLGTTRRSTPTGTSICSTSRTGRRRWTSSCSSGRPSRC